MVEYWDNFLIDVHMFDFIEVGTSESWQFIGVIVNKKYYRFRCLVYEKNDKNFFLLLRNKLLWVSFQRCGSQTMGNTKKVFQVKVYNITKFTIFFVPSIFLMSM